MCYLKALLTIIIVGTSNFFSQEGYISGAVANVNFICKTFTDSLKHWREYESDAVSAEVDFVTYAMAPEPNNSSRPVFKFIQVAFNRLLNIDDNDGDENEFKFDPKINRIAVIIYGYLGDHSFEGMQDLTRALFNWQKHNMRVIAVDWFKSYTYHTAAGAVDEVATKTMMALRKVGKQYVKKGLEKPYLHIMGHSLGAHIAGLTAKKLKANRVFNWTVDRVTGLDPAKPFFGVGDDFAAYRLDKSCAKFVDVIHTNSAQGTTTLGLYDEVGHVDFYPSGGDYQPACKEQRKEGQNSNNKSNSKSTCDKSAVGECLKGLGNDVACIASTVLDNKNMLCDHVEALKYFTKSLNGEKYSATKFGSATKNGNSRCHGKCCGTSIPMGIDASECSNDAYHGQYDVKVV